MELTHFSLCSGIGGLDLAAEWAGFRTIGQCEIDEYESKVLEKNFKGVHNFGDIRTITAESVGRYGINAGEITVISAGIPCQPYSLAGKGLGDLDERDLEQEYMRVVGELKPRWAVIENTPGLFSRKNQRYFHRILDDFSALGYSVAWGMWGAVDVGAPHERQRIFIVAHVDGERRRVCETYERVSDKRLDESLNKTSFGTSSVYGNIPDTVGERRNTNKIQRGFLEKSRDEKNERRVQESRVQFGRVCCGISVPCGKRETEWRERKLSEIGETERKRGNKRNGISVHDGWKWWEIEPDVGRVAYGVPARMERLRCLGNAVVPYQAYPIFEVIAELEEEGDIYE